jgi:hypothetical protein
VDGPLPVETVFILEPINGYTFDHFLDRGTRSKPSPSGQTSPWAPFISYRARYMRPNPKGADQPDLVDVSVMTYPNFTSARLALNNRLNWDPMPETALHQLQMITKFAGSVSIETVTPTDGTAAAIYVAWTSGESYLRLRFYDSEDDQFVWRYLRRYPNTP